MKIEANVELSPTKADECGQCFVKVDVDMDYVEANEESVGEWVSSKLEEKFGVSFCPGLDFVVENISDVLEELAFDEFERKTQYANM